MDFKSQLFCCNPLGKSGHTRFRKNLRKVQPWMVQKCPNITVEQKICSSCRKTISEMPGPSCILETDAEAEQPELSDDKSEGQVKSEIWTDRDTTLDSLNDTLLSLGETPVKKKRLGVGQYSKKKFQKIGELIKDYGGVPECDKPVTVSDESVMISQLKEKFQETDSISVKVQILTILPKTWSIRKIQEEFGVTYYMARKSKILVEEEGILTTPNPRPGKTLSDSTVENVIAYYNSDEVSRCLPGKKDFVTMIESGSKVQKQKRLILGNLKEIFQGFKDKNPNVKVGFSKFCGLRPKNCVLVGASGTHCVCVCCAHENVKLMLAGCKLQNLTRNDELPLRTYKDCLARITCNPPLPECFFFRCDACPGIAHLLEQISNMFAMNGIDEIVYKLWTTTDRTTLMTVCNTVEEFLETFESKVKLLLPHSFVAIQQSYFLSNLKENLDNNQCVVLCDFAENYSFVLQDAVQGYHWNNSQATIHPFVVYYKSSHTLQLDHFSFVVISECLKHDTISVHLFQSHLLQFISSHFDKKVEHIYYFSDGAASQYKNRKNFVNLCHHDVDFGITAEWHFFATSHGKGPCDGVAGTIKRLAARASLQCSYNDQIMTPRQLYDWASRNIPSCHFKYSTDKDYENHKEFLEIRHASARPIPGTQKLHCVIPVSRTAIQTKMYSNSTEYKVESVLLNPIELDLEDIRGYVIVVYDNQWWVGCVLDVNILTEQVKISFLHPHGPSVSFTYPQKPDILEVDKTAVITKVDLRTATGRTYFMERSEIEMVTSKMASHSFGLQRY